MLALTGLRVSAGLALPQRGVRKVPHAPYRARRKGDRHSCWMHYRRAAERPARTLSAAHLRLQQGEEALLGCIPFIGGSLHAQRRLARAERHPGSEGLALPHRLLDELLDGVVVEIAFGPFRISLLLQILACTPLGVSNRFTASSFQRSGASSQGQGSPLQQGGRWTCQTSWSAARGAPRQRRNVQLFTGKIPIDGGGDV
jgi:hypothetical protein